MKKEKLDATELIDFLNKKCGNDLESMITNQGSAIFLFYKGNSIGVRLHDDCLQLDCAIEIDDLLEEIKPLFISYTKREPICKYHQEIKGMDTMTVYEWAMTHTKAMNRIVEVEKTIGFVENSTIYGFQYLIKDFRNMDNKAYGIYPGCIENTQEYEAMTELELYLKIQELLRLLKWHQKSPNISILPQYFALRYMIRLTSKFGVVFEKSDAKENFTFKKWFDMWETYYTNSLTDKQRKDLISSITNQQDIFSFLPENIQLLQRKNDLKS